MVEIYLHTFGTVLKYVSVCVHMIPCSVWITYTCSVGGMGEELETKSLTLLVT